MPTPAPSSGRARRAGRAGLGDNGSRGAAVAPPEPCHRAMSPVCAPATGDASNTAGPARPKRRRGMAAGGAPAASLHQWMQRTPTLLGLKQQALDSRRMGAELSRLLGATLAGAVLPGRFADATWTLHASSPAVAAKLKLHVPMLLLRLQGAGWPLARIQVRVLMPQGAGGGAAPPAARPQASAAPPEVRDRKSVV